MPDSSPRKKRAVPCAAQGLAAAAELALRAQTVLADNPASPFGCSTRQTGENAESTLRVKLNQVYDSYSSEDLDERFFLLCAQRTFDLGARSTSRAAECSLG